MNKLTKSEEKKEMIFCPYYHFKNSISFDSVLHLANFQYVGQSPCLKPQLISTIIIEGAGPLAGSFIIIFSNPPGPIGFRKMIN